MTVVDVNTGKFTGSGGNLEETVTKNNLEAAEEMVRQLRLRDIGGIIVIDFIDMVLESNRDLVLRRLVECLGRDRTRHQVAEVTSLGLVQMTRKRIGTGLLEAFSTDCEHCKGRGLVLHDHPVESGGRSAGRRAARTPQPRRTQPWSRRLRRRQRGRRTAPAAGAAAKPSPADLANTRPPEKQADEPTQTAEPTRRRGAGPTKPVEPAEPASSAPEPQQVPTESGTTRRAAAAPEPQPTSRSRVRSRADARADAEPSRRPSRRPSRLPRATPGHQHPPSYGAAPGRPATRPSGAEVPDADTAGSGAAGPPSAPSAEPVDVPVEPGAPGHTPVAEPDPRPRRRPPPRSTATRPGPTSPNDPTDQRGQPTQDDERRRTRTRSSSGLSLTHVPIKRKGSRKR